jgi:hypothetical protein
MFWFIMCTSADLVLLALAHCISVGRCKHTNIIPNVEDVDGDPSVHQHTFGHIEHKNIHPVSWLRDTKLSAGLLKSVPVERREQAIRCGDYSY